MSETVIQPARLAPSPRRLPEKRDSETGWLDRVESRVARVAGSAIPPLTAVRVRRGGRRAAGIAEQLAALGTERFEAEVRELRRSLRRHGLTRPATMRALAIGSEALRRTTGAPADADDLRTALALLDGKIVETDHRGDRMPELTLAAVPAALAGLPVHLIVRNDALVARYADRIAAVCEMLGLSVGSVTQGMPLPERRAAYACNVTCVSSREIVFDYLRDRTALEGTAENLRLKLAGLFGTGPHERDLLMRGLQFALVDDADAVMIDDARAPMILSRHTDPAETRRWAEGALEIIRALESGNDYNVLEKISRIEFTERGRNRLAELGRRMGGEWRSKVRREESAQRALAAVSFYRRGEHYAVENGRIVPAPAVGADRAWHEGIQQLIEAHENCDVTGRRVPAARLSMQRFFRRYERIGGVTATARDAAGEFWSVYRLRVVQPAPVRPRPRRRPGGVRPTLAGRNAHIARRAKKLRARGRPVVILTRTAPGTASLSAALREAEIDHAVVSTLPEAERALALDGAGTPGRVTVVTAIGDSGYDLERAAKAAGRRGLHVILADRHDSRRGDRRALARCIGAGARGRVEYIQSLDDPIAETLRERPMFRTASVLGRILPFVAASTLRAAQRRIERQNAMARRELLYADHRLGDMLAFSGDAE